MPEENREKLNTTVSVEDRSSDAGDLSGRVSGSLDESDEVLGETADAGVDPTLIGASSTRTGSGSAGGDEEGVAVLPQE